MAFLIILSEQRKSTRPGRLHQEKGEDENNECDGFVFEDEPVKGTKFEFNR